MSTPTVLCESTWQEGPEGLGSYLEFVGEVVKSSEHFWQLRNDGGGRIPPACLPSIMLDDRRTGTFRRKKRKNSRYTVVRWDGKPIPARGYLWDTRVRYPDGKSERYLRHPKMSVEVCDEV